MAETILVVDDEPDVVSFLSRLLTDNGYRVISAGDAIEAMNRVRQDTPDLILLDLQMPYATGTDLYRRLRSRSPWREIPVIVVSGLAGRHVAVSPAVPVIDKPVDEDRLLREVERALGS